MKVNKKVLWELVFNFILLCMCIFVIYGTFFYTEEELINKLIDAPSNKSRRNREILIVVVQYFGKKGVILSFSICFFLIFKYRFLPSLRKFLGKEADKKEENEE